MNAANLRALVYFMRDAAGVVWLSIVLGLLWWWFVNEIDRWRG